MPCKKCGGAMEMTDNTGGVKEGSFREEYRCVNCGAHGYIRGDASEPAKKWVRYGSAFTDEI